MKKHLLLLNSSVAFALALVLTLTIHEFGHALASLILGFRPVIHAFSVDTNVATNQQHIITQLTGPIISLVVGLFFLSITSAKNSFLRLTLLWMGLLGIQQFAGYLITALFTTVGDIGNALHRLNAPLMVKLLIFAIGWVITFFVGRFATQRLIALTNPEETLAPQLRQLGLFAWLLGTGFVLVLSVDSLDFSAIGLFEIFGFLTLGIFLMFVRYFMAKVPVRGDANVYGAPIAGVISLIVVAILRQLIFGPGLHL